MAKTTTSVQAFDATGRPQNFVVEQDNTSGNLTPHHVIESDGTPVGASHALPVSDAIADAALGTPADAAWSGAGSGTIVSALKAIWTALTAGIGIKPAAITITQTVVALTSADAVIIAANANRKYLAIINIGTGLATLGFGVAAVAGQGYPMGAAAVAGDQGGGIERANDGITLQAIHGICAAGVTTNVVVIEGV